LSHGNQQRVQLAAALVHDPAVAILDEPFSGLDPLAVDDLAAILKKLAAGGTAILFSSHQLDLVQSVCQDVVIIDHGRVVLQGDVERLRDDSEQRVLEIDVDGRPFVSEHARITDGGRALIDRDTPITDIVTEAQAHGTITSLRFEPPNLSDLFRQAVKR
jgi:ABC-2 type transport system ATP-binding protein